MAAAVVDAPESIRLDSYGSTMPAAPVRTADLVPAVCAPAVRFADVLAATVDAGWGGATCVAALATTNGLALEPEADISALWNVLPGDAPGLKSRLVVDR